MNFIFQLLVAMIISAATRPKAQKIKPPGFSEVQAPTAEDGREIPVLAGRRRMPAPNWVWYGDMRTKPIKKKA